MAAKRKKDTLFAVCAPGLEMYTTLELRGCGLLPASPDQDYRKKRTPQGTGNERGGVEFRARFKAVYLANLTLRTANRVLLRLGEFYAASLPELRHKGISAFIVEKGTAGFAVGREEEKMGLRASDTTALIFEECRIPAANRLGAEGDGFRIAMSSLDGGRIGIAAQSVGVAQAALDAAVQYAQEREQFNQKISKFQGLRWIIADMATEIEAARQLMLSAADLKDQGKPHSSQASMAKLFASEMANRVTAKALQLHGGYGYTTEYPVERYLRDARVFTIYEGTSEIQRIVIANHIFNDKRLPKASQ